MVTAPKSSLVLFDEEKINFKSTFYFFPVSECFYQLIRCVGFGKALVKTSKWTLGQDFSIKQLFARSRKSIFKKTVNWIDILQHHQTLKCNRSENNMFIIQDQKRSHVVHWVQFSFSLTWCHYVNSKKILTWPNTLVVPLSPLLSLLEPRGQLEDGA